MPIVVHHGSWGTNDQQQVLAQSMGNMARTFLTLGNQQLQDKKLEQDAAKAALAAGQWEKGFQQREAQLQREILFDAGKLEAQQLNNALNRGLVDTQAESLRLDQDAQRIRNRQSELQFEQGQFDLQQARERDAILKEDRDALNSYFGANGLGLTPGKDFEEAFPSASSLYAFQQLPKSSRDQWLKARAQQLEVQKRTAGAGVLMHNAEGQAVLSDRFDQEQAKAIIQAYQAGELSDAEAQEALLIEGRRATFLDQKASVMEMVRAGYEQATSLNGAQMTGLDQEELEAVMRELSKAQFDPRAGYDQYDFTSIVVPLKASMGQPISPEELERFSFLSQEKRDEAQMRGHMTMYGRTPGTAGQRLSPMQQGPAQPQPQPQPQQLAKRDDTIGTALSPFVKKAKTAQSFDEVLSLADEAVAAIEKELGQELDAIEVESITSDMLQMFNFRQAAEEAVNKRAYNEKLDQRSQQGAW